MDHISTDALKAELIRRAQSRDATYNRVGGDVDPPSLPTANPELLQKMTAGIARGAPPAALQGFRYIEATEESGVMVSALCLLLPFTIHL